MLTIIVGEEYFNEEDQTFSIKEGVELELEHSLVSLSKWESLVQKPFLSTDEKSPQEIRQYVEAMIISTDYPPDIVRRLSRENMQEINAYIDSPQTATTFGAMPETRGRGETITSELIYYWMVAFNVPFEVERWHLNRLFALIRICNLKNSKQKKTPKHDLAARNRALNEQRRAKLNTKG